MVLLQFNMVGGNYYVPIDKIVNIKETKDGKVLINGEQIEESMDAVNEILKRASVIEADYASKVISNALEEFIPGRIDVTGPMVGNINKEAIEKILTKREESNAE